MVTITTTLHCIFTQPEPIHKKLKWFVWLWAMFHSLLHITTLYDHPLLTNDIFLTSVELLHIVILFQLSYTSLEQVTIN